MFGIALKCYQDTVWGAGCILNMDCRTLFRVIIKETKFESLINFFGLELKEKWKCRA